MKSRRLVGVFLLLVGGVLAVVGGLRLLEPNEYRAVAMVQGSETPPNYSGPYFLLTDFQTIESHPVFSNVVGSMHLNERWGRKYNHGAVLGEAETEELIKRHVDLRNVRNTRVIEIITYDDDPEEAAKLANAISESYRQVRWDEQRRLAEAKNPGAIIDRPVELISPAIPEFRPVRPDRYLAGAMLGCGLFLMIVGIACWNHRKAMQTE